MARRLDWGAKPIATQTGTFDLDISRVSRGTLIVSKLQNSWSSVLVQHRGGKFRFIRSGVLAVYISRRGRMITALMDGQVVKTDVTGWAIPRKIKSQKV